MTVEAKTSVALSDPDAVMRAFAARVAQHGIDVQEVAAHAVRVVYRGCQMDLQCDAASLSIRVLAPSRNMLFFLKEEIVEGIEEVDKAAAEELRWADDDLTGQPPPNFYTLEVVRRATVFPGMIRVTLTGQDVAALNRDGIHVKLMMPLHRSVAPVWPTVAANGKTVWPQGEHALHSRYVTIRTLRLEDRELDIDIAHHQGGLISDWASRDGAGDSVGVMGPGGDAGLDRRDGLLLIGDTTGMPAIARLLESLNGAGQGHVIVPGPDLPTVAAYLPRTSLAVHPIPVADFEAEVVPKARALGGKGVTRYAWFGGEFANAQALRALFKGEFGLGKTEQLSIAYWRRGVPGHAARAV